MHYQDGREIKIGDLARTVANPEFVKGGVQTEYVGKVVNGVPSSQACNVSLEIVLAREVGPMGVGPWRSSGTLSYAQSVNSGDLLCLVPVAEAAQVVAA